MKADKLIRSRRVNAKNVEREREFEGADWACGEFAV